MTMTTLLSTMDTLAFFSVGEFSLRLRYLSPQAAIAIYVVLSAAVVIMGWRRLAWLGAGRRAAIVAARLAVLYVVVLLLGGAEATRRSDDLSVMVVRDVSESVRLASESAVGDEAVDSILRASTAGKRLGDNVGVVAFDAVARVESLPRPEYSVASRSVRERRAGTNTAEAIQLAMASFDGRSMKRMVLISDGNDTQGALDDALTAATAAGVPIDVVPVEYNVREDVVMDRVVAPVWRREGEPFHLEVVLRNLGPNPVSGSLSVTHQGLPVDLDAENAGIQSSRAATLKPGANVLRVTVPATTNAGVHRFRAVFTPESGDALPRNNAADAFTFVRGRGRVLYIDNFANGEGSYLLEALRREGIGIDERDHRQPMSFPSDLLSLQEYDAIILGNVPRGPGGISDDQSRALVEYVRETGGGLIVTGGPDGLGAGAWQQTELAGALPVDLEVPARRITPGGALVLAIDHSGSMSAAMPGGATSKMASAQQSALLAINGLMPADLVGVVAFDSAANWAYPLQRKGDHDGAAAAIRKLGSGGGTDIYPALELAITALQKLAPSEAGVKHVLLLTDGRTVPNSFDGLLQRMNNSKITLSTIAIGVDADLQLLAWMAQTTGGTPYVVNDPTQLTQVFVREARTIRRSLIHEPEGGVAVARTPAPAELLAGVDAGELPQVLGLVVTSPRNDPNAHVPLVTAGSHADPILAHWQHGLGRVAVFTPEPTRRWTPDWVASPQFGKVWAQMVRGVSRAPMSGDFETQMVRQGDTTRIVVDALDATGGMNGLTITGTAISPDSSSPPQPVRLEQFAPGRYQAVISTPDAGTYVTALQFAGSDGRRGSILAGLSINESIEHRNVTTDDAQLREIARRTGGRVLPALGTAPSYDLFDRANVAPAIAYLPLNAVLLGTLVGLCLVDVAIRRIQIDRATLALAVAKPLAWVRSFTTTRKIETTESLDALRRVRAEKASQPESATTPPPAPTGPVRTTKFEAKEDVSGDIAKVVGGATDAPLPPPPKKATPQGATPASDTTGSLLEAKRRAQQKIRDAGDGK